MSIQLAESDAQIDGCFEVMSQLRPHLPRSAFVQRVRRQQQGGFQMAYLEDAGRVTAVAGFRIVENLAWGRHMYVDDLVTDEAARSTGQGRRLFEWLTAHAREAGCEQLHLDSGVQRFDAHRFYLTHRMRITSHHFAMEL